MFLVASDYDRTLASEKNGFIIDKEVAYRVNEFVKKFPFVVVTGREKKFIDILANGLKPTAWILENGALILLDGKEHYLVNDEWLTVRDNITAKLDKMGLSYSMGKIIIYLDKIDKFKNKLSFNNARIEWNRSDAMIMPSYVDKGYGLKQFIEMINFKGKTIGVGDSENDISLFRSVNYKVAVGNALKEIKEIADIILDEEDGKGIIKLLNMIESGEITKILRVNKP